MAVATAAALRRLGRGGEPAVPGLALAIVFNVAAYLPTPYVQNLLSTREISAVLPFGAVLAGRVLAAPLLRARLTAAPAAAGLVFAVALGCHAAGPGGARAEPEPGLLARRPAPDRLPVRRLLGRQQHDAERRRADHGPAGVRCGMGPWCARCPGVSNPARYDPVTCYADFLVARGRGPEGWGAAAARAFGPPARALHPGGYTVLVWHKNLLADVG